MKNNIVRHVLQRAAVCLIVLGLAAPCSAGDPIDDPWAYIENEEMIGEHKRPAHTDFRSYTTIDSALAGGRQKFRQSLDGDWSFNWVRDPADRPRTFMDPAQNSLSTRAGSKEMSSYISER